MAFDSIDNPKNQEAKGDMHTNNMDYVPIPPR